MWIYGSGHFRKCCRTRANKRKVGDILSKAVTAAKKPKTKCAEEVDYIFHLYDDDFITCSLGNVKLDMLIDSGSKCNIINDQTWEIQKSSNVYVENQVKNREITLMANGSQKPLTVLGSFESSIVVGKGFRVKKATQLDVYSVKTRRLNWVCLK